MIIYVVVSMIMCNDKYIRVMNVFFRFGWINSLKEFDINLCLVLSDRKVFY